VEIHGKGHGLGAAVAKQHFGVAVRAEQLFGDDRLGGHDQVGKLFVVGQIFDKGQHQRHVRARGLAYR